MEEFTIYYGTPEGKDTKIGVDSKYPSRIKSQKILDAQVLEVHTDIYEASRREQELQREYGLAVDKVPYHIVYFNNKKPERCSKLSASKTGHDVTEETRNKISESLKGNKHSQETRDKIGRANKGNTYTLGKKHSQETRDKMSRSHKGHIVTKETRDKISESNLGRRWKVENTINYSKAKKGIPLPRINCTICGDSIPPSHMERHLNRKNPCQPK